MPTLKPYRNKPGFYIQASIHGGVVTLQVTERGVEKLRRAGIEPAQKFSSTLLSALTKAGDAYTHTRGITTGGEFYEADQFEFDFDENKESERLFPKCEVYGTFDDLELIVEQHADAYRTTLISPAARAFLKGRISLSMPLWLLSPPVLQRLEETGHLPPGSPTVELLREWYNQGAQAEWELVRRQSEDR